MYRFHRSLKIMIIDNILVDWQSSKKVISFPTLVISFVKSYQFSDTCHSNNSSHISDQCGQKKFIYFCWPIIFYSWYIFWYHMGLGTSKNIIIYIWFTLKVMYPNEACYTYQFCEIFSIQCLSRATLLYNPYACVSHGYDCVLARGCRIFCNWYKIAQSFSEEIEN